jgi:hypothetical protein
MFAGGALWLTRNLLGIISITTISPPQDLQTPGFIPILSNAISCHGLSELSFGGDCFKHARIIARDFVFEALDKNPYLISLLWQ